ncbi:hypothetical protein ACLB1E_37340 [Escherichia coli]
MDISIGKQEREAKDGLKMMRLQTFAHYFTMSDIHYRGAVWPPYNVVGTGHPGEYAAQIVMPPDYTGADTATLAEIERVKRRLVGGTMK